MIKTNEYDKKIFAKNLLHYMSLNNENQSDVAKILGVSKTTVTHYIQGINVPRMNKIQILCDHYGIKITDLMEEREEQKPEPETIHTIAAHAVGKLSEEDAEKILKFAQYLLSEEDK